MVKKNLSLNLNMSLGTVTDLVAGQWTFQCRGCHLWNSLPQQIQCATVGLLAYYYNA